MFPTEVVFALDLSNNVSQLDFERMRDILLSLLMKMDISRSNCPVGAQVAIISYDTKTDYLIHFSDYKGPSLLQGIRNIPLEGSSGSRNLGDAMRFKARHMFNRACSGLVMRKVAVFFPAGWARDAEAVSADTLGLHVLDITPVAVSFTEEHNLPEVLLRGRAGGGWLVAGDKFPRIDV